MKIYSAVLIMILAVISITPEILAIQEVVTKTNVTKKKVAGKS